MEREEVVEKALMEGLVKAPWRACRIDCMVIGNSPLGVVVVMVVVKFPRSLKFRVEN